MVAPLLVLDPSYRRPGDGGTLIGGSPLKLFRLSPGGVRVMEAIERGETPPAGHRPLTDRLIDAGVLHPTWPEPSANAPAAAGHFTVADVTVVVPAHGTEPRLATAGVAVIVVDDASEPPLRAAAGQRVVRLERNAGPGPARNAGLAQVTTPLVAFVDTDVALPGGWLDPLLRHFGDERVALVAPRVASAPGSSRLSAYEERYSPLDLGTLPGRVHPGSRISYVPAAALVCRVDAVRAIGGFDAALRHGEDVDLVWRLCEAGWRCRYEPASVVHHRPRPTWRAAVRQRFDYGSSAAPLAARHPGALAPLRVGAWSAAVWALVATRRPVMAATVAAGTAVALQRKLRGLPTGESNRLAALGHAHAGRQIAQATMRAWWPLALVAAAVSRPARPALVAAALLPPILDQLTGKAPDRTRIDPMRATLAHLVDDVAYGAGVWAGALRHRTIAPLVPDLTSWPGRRDR